LIVLVVFVALKPGTVSVIVSLIFSVLPEFNSLRPAAVSFSGSSFFFPLGTLTEPLTTTTCFGFGRS
jgi:hypothetical protein